METSVKSLTEQFTGILIAEPEIEAIRTVSSGKHYVRIKFRIWPGKGSAIETTFKQDVLEILKTFDPSADATDISVNYETAER